MIYTWRYTIFAANSTPKSEPIDPNLPEYNESSEESDPEKETEANKTAA